MRSPRVGLTAAAILVVLAAGCGDAPTAAVPKVVGLRLSDALPQIDKAQLCLAHLSYRLSEATESAASGTDRVVSVRPAQQRKQPRYAGVTLVDVIYVLDPSDPSNLLGVDKIGIASPVARHCGTPTYTRGNLVMFMNRH